MATFPPGRSGVQDAVMGTERTLPAASPARVVPVARARLAWGIAFGSIVLLGIVAAYLTVTGLADDLVLLITIGLATAAFGVVGATIAARTDNGVGWALLGVIGTVNVGFSAEAYATYSIVQADRPLPLDTVAAWLGTVAFFLSIALIVAIPLLYPTGTPRWRWVWRLYVVASTVLVIGFAILPQELGIFANDVRGPQNPFAITSIEGAVGGIVAAAGLTLLVCAGLSVVSLVVRYRAAEGDERQQVKWLAYVGIAAVFVFFVNVAIQAIVGDAPKPGLETVISNGAFDLFLWIVLFGIPAACGIAILKYRLYDLDVVVRKTVVFTLVAATLTALYLAVIALATVGNVSRLVVGIVLLAVTFRPVRRAARAVADRLVYGRRASAYEVLTEFSGRVGETYATEDVLPRMAQILGKGAGATCARVLLRVGGELRTVATWPDDAAPGADERSVPVVHQGEELGALAVTMPPNDPLDPSRERLLSDLAAQAGLVLRNVRLIEELRASRQRLVAAQDQERRKIERNLHDGVQQQLVALNVQLGLLARVAGTDPTKAAELATSLQGRASDALEDLRDLARGIYPPLLADQGLSAALEAQARKAAVPTTVAADGIGRYPQDVESAVYFCCLEALNNVAKYANATAATIGLRRDAAHLRFEIRDDGVGFDTIAGAHGTGLQGMADRLDAIGGTLTVISAPGAGTSIVGMVPTM
jgi:signal transduction histidine kinase